MSSAKPKRKGRPPKPGGRDVLVAGRVPPATATKLDAIAKQYKITRSEALRRTIEASAVITEIELPVARKPRAKGGKR
jgi:hypothetical protein